MLKEDLDGGLVAARRGKLGSALASEPAVSLIRGASVSDVAPLNRISILSLTSNPRSCLALDHGVHSVDESPPRARPFVTLGQHAVLIDRCVQLRPGDRESEPVVVEVEELS